MLRSAGQQPSLPGSASSVGATRRTLGQIYDRYRAQVLRLARGRLRDPDQARDAAQEVFLRVASGIRSLAADPTLRGRVKLLGELSPAAAVRVMAASNLMLSTSVMESYGMALDEARTLGLPILATAGGHTSSIWFIAQRGARCSASRPSSPRLAWRWRVIPASIIAACRPHERGLGRPVRGRRRRMIGCGR
jgi:hypothetical protein